MQVEVNAAGGGKDFAVGLCAGTGVTTCPGEVGGEPVLSGTVLFRGETGESWSRRSSMVGALRPAVALVIREPTACFGVCRTAVLGASFTCTGRRGCTFLSCTLEEGEDRVSTRTPLASSALSVGTFLRDRKHDNQTIGATIARQKIRRPIGEARECSLALAQTAVHSHMSHLGPSHGNVWLCRGLVSNFIILAWGCMRWGGEIEGSGPERSFACDHGDWGRLATLQFLNFHLTCGVSRSAAHEAYLPRRRPPPRGPGYAPIIIRGGWDAVAWWLVRKAPGPRRSSHRLIAA